MKLCRENPVLAAAIEDTIHGTVVYPADGEIELNCPKAGPGRITVSGDRSFQAAMKLRKAYPDSRIAVHNFASATNPGGGVERGSSAQEEALCRCSTLYPCLKTDDLFRKFYGFHRAGKDVRYTDACIYTPGILIVKSDTDFPELLPEKKWNPVDVITCAAPNLRERPYNAMNPGSGAAVKVSDRELLDIHKSRAGKILRAAAANGADCLVLGAFGCGAFCNDPRVVARAYKEVLPDYAEYFTEIVFAVYCSPRDSRNYEVFRGMLGK